MNDVKTFLNRLPTFPIFSGLSLAFGLLVPTIFELGEKPAARSRHLEMECASISALFLTLLITTLCWYRCQPSESEHSDSSPHDVRRVQFGMRGLLGGMTLAGVLLAAAPYMQETLSSAIVIVGVLLMLIWSLFYSSPIRCRAGTLIASMYLPFVWMVLYNRPIGNTSGLIEVIPLGPAIVPATLASGQIDNAYGLAAAFIFIYLLAGAWLIRHGTLFFAYLVLMLLFSCFNSFMMHVLYRA